MPIKKACTSTTTNQKTANKQIPLNDLSTRVQQYNCMLEPTKKACTNTITNQKIAYKQIPLNHLSTHVQKYHCVPEPTKKACTNTTTNQKIAYKHNHTSSSESLLYSCSASSLSAWAIIAIVCSISVNRNRYSSHISCIYRVFSILFILSFKIVHQLMPKTSCYCL